MHNMKSLVKCYELLFLCLVVSSKKNACILSKNYQNIFCQLNIVFLCCFAFFPVFFFFFNQRFMCSKTRRRLTVAAKGMRKQKPVDEYRGLLNPVWSWNGSLKKQGSIGRAGSMLSSETEIRMWCLSKREALIQLHVILVICLLWVFSICLAEWGLVVATRKQSLLPAEPI